MIGLEHPSDVYSSDKTVFLCSKNKYIQNIVYGICKHQNLKVFDATESGNSITDWLAVPFFVCVVDRGWYNSHQDEINEYSSMGVNDSINFIQIGEDPVRKNDSGRFVPLSDSDFFKAVEYSIIHEKKRFDGNLVKNTIA